MDLNFQAGQWYEIEVTHRPGQRKDSRFKLPPPTGDLKYLVFRSSNGLDGPFGHVTSIAPAEGTTFTDSFAPFGPKLYGIRAIKRHDGPSGSYMNISQTTYIEVN